MVAYALIFFSSSNKAISLPFLLIKKEISDFRGHTNNILPKRPRIFFKKMLSRHYIAQRVCTHETPHCRSSLILENNMHG
jgi:hypothetical protein